jgi:hypothetical protein
MTDGYAGWTVKGKSPAVVLDAMRAQYDWRPRYCRCRGPRGQRRQLAEVALHTGASMVWLRCPWCDLWTPREPGDDDGREIRCGRAVTNIRHVVVGDQGCGALLGRERIADDEAALIRCRCGTWNAAFSTGMIVIRRSGDATPT